jgi:N,N'-diacetyllegionaminate synthase
MNNCYIIAEAGVNHNGSEAAGIELIEVAKRSGADAIKFQTFKAKNLASFYSDTAYYQKINTKESNQYSMLKKLEISKKMHIKFFNKCKDLNIDFLSTPFDLDSANFLISLGMKKLKISSGEITNLPFIQDLAKLNIPIILSTGMSSMEEVKIAVSVIKNTRDENKLKRPLSEVLTILHCTSNYPAEFKDINLNAMKSMSDSLSIPVGYSDHSKGILVSSLAVAMGARVIEKHFTLDKKMDGPDHKASLTPDELSNMITQIRETEKCLGDGIKIAKKSEISTRDLVRRSVALLNDKNKGEVLNLKDLTVLRPGNGIPPVELKNIVGKKIIKSLKKGQILTKKDID